MATKTDWQQRVAFLFSPPPLRRRIMAVLREFAEEAEEIADGHDCGLGRICHTVIAKQIRSMLSPKKKED